ncbi:MAG: 3-deoxy-8-phosphooctulonate synthase [Calditrichia bacterium]
MSNFSVEDLYKEIKGKSTFTLIAGPCVLESQDTVFQIIEFILRMIKNLPVTYIFKASFEKANRTSSKGFRGPGLELGIHMFEKIKKEFDIPILTDVHNELQVSVIKNVVDIIQIPAFLSRQTALLEEAGRSNKIVNIKKAQFMAPEDIKNAAEKVVLTGNHKIMLTERGTSFGYHNLVVDMRGLLIMEKFGYPVIYDATHSVQLPSGGGTMSGGQPEFIIPLASAALATGALSGVFLETHPDPENALSDAASMLPLNQFKAFLDRALHIFEMLKTVERV